MKDIESRRKKKKMCFPICGEARTRMSGKITSINRNRLWNKKHPTNSKMFKNLS